MFQFRSLKQYFTLVIGLLVTLSLSAVGFAVYYFGGNIVMESGRALNISRANDFRHILNGEYAVLMEKVNGISQMDTVLKAEKLEDTLVPLSQTFSFYKNDFDTMNIMDLTGDRYNNSMEKGNNSDREYYKKVMQTKEPYISEVLVGRATGKLSVVFVSPWVKQSGEMMGMVFGLTGLDKIQASIAEIKIGKTGFGFLVDGKGLLLAHGKNKDWSGKVNLVESDIGKFPIKPFWEQAVRTKNVVSGDYVVDGVKKSASVIPLELIGGNFWYMIVESDFDEVMADASKLNTIVFSLSFVALIISLIITYLIAKTFVAPIESLNAYVGELGKGRFDIPVPESYVRRKDEYGSLASNFTKMRLNVSNLLRSISSSAESVAASAEELFATSQQSAQASAQVANAATQVAHNVNDQSVMVHDVHTITSTTIKMLDEVVQNAEHVNTLSNDMVTVTDDGSHAVNAAIAQINTVGQGSAQAQVAADELKQDSKKIGEIVNLISSIAGQTNLLALNAAIEAARAGEQGRGFAVVAEEVRKLAEQSENAAKQITDLINKNYKSIENVVNTVGITIKDVDEGVILVNNAGESFEKINTNIKIVSAEIKIIAGKLTSLATSSAKITDSVNKMEKATDNIESEIENTTAATEEQSASMQEIAGASQTLAKLANDLQSDVSKFKIA